MAELMPVPEVAAGATEVVVSEWLVKPGDQVTAGASVAVVETEKAVVEVVAETDATLLRILADAGSQVEVGAPMALLGSAAEAAGDIVALLAALGVHVGPAAGPGAAATGASAQPETPTPTATASPHAEQPAHRPFISPLARKMLKQAGLSADGVTGTGPNGRIRRRDVEAAIAAARDQAAARPSSDPAPADPEPVAPAAVAVSQGPWTEIPHSRLRRAIEIGRAHV